MIFWKWWVAFFVNRFIMHGDQVVSREKDWKYWCDTEFPEEEDIPSGLEKGLSIFRKLLLIRSWCPDRTLSQARKYIADSLGLEFLENKVRVPGEQGAGLG